ncbi:MAG TPA: sulfite exporter TauE/SafE family protein [Ideonella sp.]|uniref:sulfite exporter TauE/SafE family protein n=1 Tax=Ideonella sp. TaxID=1929293 RepID=UPI002C3CADC3|nr:sulfite exporter TauE/SafE family protein [Ideonella sp.]HSI50336.1 sulfite exporter TauE/SafE family protein [Ideonella sp.]
MDLSWGLGAIVGLILALTGAGGGVLAVPLLVFGLHLTVQQAAPVALLAVGASAGLGAVLGLRDGIVRYRAASLIGGLAMLTAPLGVALAQHLPPRPLTGLFAMVLGWTAWRMWQQSRPAAAQSAASPAAPRQLPPCVVDAADGRLRWTAPCAWVLAATGAASGLLTGLLGVGGGFVIVPSLTHWTDLDARSIAATSLAVIALATLSGLVAATGHGHLDAGLALSFGGAAVVALLIGRVLAKRLPAAMLKRVFAVVSALVAVMMLLRALNPTAA